jgi:serine/threonine protein kinase
VPGTGSQAYTTNYSRGTPSYRAPELITNGKYNNKVDIWAIGCILFELVFREKAFVGDYAVLQYHQLPGELSVPMKDGWDMAQQSSFTELIHRLLDLNPIRRPEADKLMMSLKTIFSEPDEADEWPAVIKWSWITSNFHGVGQLESLLGSGTFGPSYKVISFKSMVLL